MNNILDINTGRPVDEPPYVLDTLANLYARGEVRNAIAITIDHDGIPHIIIGGDIRKDANLLLAGVSHMVRALHDIIEG